MGRFTKAYTPEAFVFAVRVSEVCSSTAVTCTLGITLPDESVTSPVMPPSVCCAKSDGAHSATAAATAGSQGSRDESLRMKCFKIQASERDLPMDLLNCSKKHWVE